MPKKPVEPEFLSRALSKMSVAISEKSPTAQISNLSPKSQELFQKSLRSVIFEDEGK